MMKDLILIDSDLLNNFCVEVIETANYMQNRLSTKSKNYEEIIPKES